jgi:SAM-dependent methyltransferase
VLLDARTHAASALFNLYNVYVRITNTLMQQFDAVLASNLLCRLPKPRAFLAALIGLVKPGGAAVIVSPYSWLTEYTPREEWLCSSSNSSSSSSGGSFEALQSIMQQEGAFQLESRCDMPFLIREHARKFQWGVSDCTVWRRSSSDSSSSSTTA